MTIFPSDGMYQTRDPHGLVHVAQYMDAVALPQRSRYTHETACGLTVKVDWFLDDGPLSCLVCLTDAGGIPIGDRGG